MHPQAYRLSRTTVLHRQKSRLRRLGVYWSNAVDIVSGLIRDLSPHEETAVPVVLRQPAGKRWCFYAAYSPRSKVTEMVLTQLRIYAERGFSVVFISMSETISDTDRARLAEVCTHVLHRKSFGRDFGAWAAAARALESELSDAEVLLLANDSVLGPICPLDPWLDACLERPGFFGLTESIKGGFHLQSYFLVANGEKVVADALAFLRTMKLTHSKWLMIQRGEIEFARAMQKAGHHTAAVLDYETIENALLDNRDLLVELEILYPQLTKGLGSGSNRQDRYLLRSRLFRLPLNPNHQLNSVLLDHFHFPFVKIDLVTKNQGLIPSAPDWRYFLAEDSPATEEMIDDHLTTLTW